MIMDYFIFGIFKYPSKLFQIECKLQKKKKSDCTKCQISQISLMEKTCLPNAYNWHGHTQWNVREYGQ